MDKINESRHTGKRKTAALVTGQSEIAPGIFDLRVKTALAEEAVPGQFVGICPADGSRILPRPISVCGIDRTEDILRFVYRVAGAGTEEFSGLAKGDTIDIIGMLGNGFPLKRAEGRKVFIIGGGIGLPPLLETARQIKGCRQIVLGYRNSTTFMLDEFRQYGTVTVATEDGSLGTRGNVLDAIKENGLTADVMFACGPMPMLRALKRYAAENGTEAYISLEERMACGVGACLGCVCRTVHEDSHSHVHNARICTEGPVFNAEDVDI
jgi:dihydroorotate dehydrogenase electron transfer subunit